MCLREASKLVQKVLHKTFNGQDNLYLHDDDALLNVPSKDSKISAPLLSNPTLL
jgi:hypothetical protein